MAKASCATLSASGNVEKLLALYRSVRRWKDAGKELQLALFPSYVFVHMDMRDRLQVLQLPGVCELCQFRGEYRLHCPITRLKTLSAEEAPTRTRIAAPLPEVAAACMCKAVPL